MVMVSTHVRRQVGCAYSCASLSLPTNLLTQVPGAFLVGPTVSHGKLSFCFIYKFRQRFGIVANTICTGLGRDTTKAVEACRKLSMYLDDFSCCKSACGEAC